MSTLDRFSPLLLGLACVGASTLAMLSGDSRRTAILVLTVLGGVSLLLGMLGQQEGWPHSPELSIVGAGLGILAAAMAAVGVPQAGKVGDAVALGGSIGFWVVAVTVVFLRWRYRR